jgi:uncharacterized lipoprotein YmbA
MVNLSKLGDLTIIVLASMLAFITGGCSAMLAPVERPINYYVLNPEIPPPAVAPAPAAVPPAATSSASPAISVNPLAGIHLNLALPAYLDRPEIVLRTGENRLDIREQELWSEPLAKAAERLLALNLSKRLNLPRVITGSPAGVAAGTVLAKVEIISFDGTPESAVRLAARWRFSTHDGAALGDGSATLEVAVGSKSEKPVSDYTAYAAAMSRAISELAAKIAGNLVIGTSHTAAP